MFGKILKNDFEIIDEFKQDLKSENLLNESTQEKLEEIIDFANKIADSNFEEKEVADYFLNIMPKMEYLLDLRQRLLEKKAEKIFTSYIQ